MFSYRSLIRRPHPADPDDTPFPVPTHVSQLTKPTYSLLDDEFTRDFFDDRFIERVLCLRTRVDADLAPDYLEYDNFRDWYALNRH